MILLLVQLTCLVNCVDETQQIIDDSEVESSLVADDRSFEILESIYERVVRVPYQIGNEDSGSATVEPEAMMQLVSQGVRLYRAALKSNVRMPPQAKVYNEILLQLRSLRAGRTGSIEGCQAKLLAQRLEISGSFENLSHLSDFFNHFNGKQFAICRTQIDAKVTSSVGQFAKLGDRMKRLKSAIQKSSVNMKSPDTDMGQTSSSSRPVQAAAFYDKRINFELVARGVKAAMASYPSHPEKSTKQTWDSYNQSYILYLNKEYNECGDLLKRLRKTFEQMFVPLTENQQFVSSIAPLSLEWMENTNLCMMIEDQSEPIHLLADDKLPQYLDMISNKPANANARHTPHRMHLTIEKLTRILPYRVLLLGESYRTQMERADRLFELTQSGPHHCREDYFAKIWKEYGLAGENVPLRNFIQHYGQLRLGICAPFFDQLIDSQASFIQPQARASVRGLRQAILLAIKEQRALIDPLLFHIDRNFMINALANYARVIREQTNQQDVIQKFLNDCGQVEEKLGKFKRFFNTMEVLDQENRMFDLKSRTWMEIVNICHNLIENFAAPNQQYYFDAKDRLDLDWNN